jgi:hypothetical protein
MSEAIAPNTPEPAWVERLLAEHAELGQRVDKLGKFIDEIPSDSPAWKTERVALLVTQFHAMQSLHGILTLRFMEYKRNGGELVV